MIQDDAASPTAPVRTRFCGQQAFLRFASLFAPQSVVGYDKIRAGSEFDGGYVMLDDFTGIDRALSFGVGENADWDLAVARRGVAVEQYDHTIEQPPLTDPAIKFFKKKLVGSSADSDSVTLASASDFNETSRTTSIILKIDIEGDEWPVLDECGPAVLDTFSQIIVEFHDFSRAVDDGWLERANRVLTKLTAGFFVFHVHGNNWNQMASISNVPFPEVLEVSFANRSRFSFRRCDTLFPTPLDRPNDPRVPELYLGAFRYAPV